MDRLKLWLNFSKFVLGTVGLGVITMIVDRGIKSRELALEEQSKKGELQLNELKQDQEFLEKFIVYAMDDNLEKRIQFAHYFTRISRQEETRKLWCAYWNDLLKLKEKLEKEKDQLKKTIESGVPNDQMDDAKKRIAFIDSEITSQKQLHIQNLSIGCDLGDIGSCHALGVRYLYGQGVSKDKVKSQEYFAKACSRGFKASCKYLDELRTQDLVKDKMQGEKNHQ